MGKMIMRSHSTDKDIQKVYAVLKEECDPMTVPLYSELVETLWNLPHREEKYIAIDVAMHYKKCIVLDNLPLYESMIREEFMWWDLVDPLATNIIGTLTKNARSEMEPVLRSWIEDDNMWIRRTAILAQLKHKEQTNGDMLLEFCRRCMREQEFFIRKAIGWALREYAKTEPERVKTFLLQEKEHLSGLSFREASRTMVKEGKM